MAGIVSLKASLEAWDRVDEILRQSLETYARTLQHIEQHLSRRAAERFNMKGLDFGSQRDALARSGRKPGFGMPVLETVSQEVESELRTFGERLCEHACSSQDLRDVAAALNQAIAGIQEIGGKHQQVMRTAAGRLRTASESDNVTALRILVRCQSAELLRLADDAARENEALASSLKGEVTELTAGLRTARQEARQDTLTGMLNRRALEEMMAEFAHKETPHCLILLDLDRFKSINDKFGYLSGDDLLRQVAVRIQSALPSSCAAARWGGDEFIILVDGSISTGMSVARKMDQQLRTSYRLGEGQAANVYAQASVGLSDWKRGESANTVVARADLALKAKKRSMEPTVSDPAR
jgi:diguanylate cyclase (GGDEF)-like protein